MDQQDIREEHTDIGKEMKAVGFLSDKARRGLITWIFGILAALLFSSVSLNIWQFKRSGDREDAANNIIREQAKEMSQIRYQVDTVLLKHKDVKSTTP